MESVTFDSDMHPLKHSINEFLKAQETLEKLKTESNLEEFEKHWRDFLNYLDKCWEKSKKEGLIYKNKFEPWNGKFANLRRNDPLLQYLEQSRDADNHSVQELIMRKTSVIKITADEGDSYIESVRIIDGKLSVSGKGDIQTEYEEPRIVCKAISNRGKPYPLPSYHRGKPIKKNDDAYTLGSLALSFYKKYLEQLEEKFAEWGKK